MKNGRIAAIGSLRRQFADVVIRGAQLFAAPGFVDMHTDSDHYLTLFSNPPQQDFLLQGVTTIMGGQCGSSLAPLLYGTLESIRKWSNSRNINVDWHSFAEFKQTLESLPIGVNFGSLIGHSTIRRALIGETLRDLTLSELAVFKKLVADAAREGAFGLSFGLGYLHSRGTPFGEMLELAKMLGPYNALLSIHLRNHTAKLHEAVDEVVRLAKQGQTRVLISHLMPVKGFEAEYETALGTLEALGNESEVYFDTFYGTRTHMPIYMLLPEWAQMSNLEAMSAHLIKPGVRERLTEYFVDMKGEDLTVSVAEAVPYLEGKTLQTFQENRNLSAPEALYELMRLTKLRATVLYENLDADLLIKGLSHGRSFIASNSASFAPLKHPSERARTFPNFLALMLKKKALTLEAAVRKITRAPAEFLHLADRGVLKEDWLADITLFSVSNSSDVIIEHTIVNGVLSVHNRTLADAANGAIVVPSQ